MSARKIRVSNVSYASGLPYRALQEIDWISYSESSVTRNAKLLHEGEVDVALISVAEFALHGGYVGLDFGVAAEYESQTVFLCAEDDISKLSTVYLYEGASSTAVLLRLLLSEQWNISPRLVRVRGQDLYPRVHDTEGALVMDYSFGPPEQKMRVREDLVRAWRAMTGMPFAFMIWATRPETLSMNRLRQLGDTFHRAVKARESIALQHFKDSGVASEDLLRNYMTKVLTHYFDNHIIKSLNHFFALAAKKKLLPSAEYRSATFTLLDRRAKKTIPEASMSRLLLDVSSGKRIGIRDGIRLARHASLADLGLAAEMFRNRIFSERSIRLCVEVPLTEDDSVKSVIQSLRKRITPELKSVVLLTDLRSSHELPFYEQLCHEIRQEFGVGIEGFPVPIILGLAHRHALPYEVVVGRLVTAGLDCIPCAGGGMLIDRIMEKRGDVGFSAREWIEVVRSAHKHGARSSCCLAISEEETWEERLIHLKKIRTLQDEVPGFRYFYVTMAQSLGSTVSGEIRLRALMVGRLFLDNIPYVEEVSIEQSPSAGMLSLSFGASEVRLSTNSPDLERARKMLASFSEIGMDFNAQDIQRLNDGKVH